MKKIYLVSACLLGLNTRYDGKSKGSGACRRFIGDAILIPVCPEQLGGLPTPRTPAEITGGQGGEVLAGTAKVMNRENVDVTSQFVAGARQVLRIAEEISPDAVLLKSGSPSCGCGDFIGVTAALLKEHGFELIAF